MHGFPEWFIYLLLPETWIFCAIILVGLAVLAVKKFRK